MKLFHLSDLHLGKRVNEFSMLEDQEYILREILQHVDLEKPDGVLISGDVYDKALPPAEAVRLFDDFLVRLARKKVQVFVISGNHDSAERIAFGGRLMDVSGIHLSPVYDGRVEPVSLEDEYGPVHFFLLPFLKPAHVRAAFPEKQIDSYTDAMRVAVSKMEINLEKRNVLLTHQFVTGAERSDSEEISVGGTDNVDASVFDPFDYVALGHIHGPQNIGSEKIRYCGTPLKYSFSERNHVKSITVVELGRKGDLQVSTIPLKPRHDLREIRGTYDELTLKANYEDTAVDDYLHIILTDEDDVPDAMARLRMVYPNLMKLDYDNTRTRTSAVIQAADEMERKSEIELFAEFYEKQNGLPLSVEQREFAENLISRLKSCDDSSSDMNGLRDKTDDDHMNAAGAFGEETDGVPRSLAKRDERGLNHRHSNEKTASQSPKTELREEAEV